MATQNQPTLRYDGLVLAGGGCRCFWQLGVYREALHDAPLRYVSAASAGAAMASVALTGAIDRAVQNFVRATRNNRKNFYPERILRGVRPFPQAGLFQQTVLKTLDQRAISRLQEGPEFRVALARTQLPRWTIPATLPAAVASYFAERQYTERIHTRWPQRFGWKVEWQRANECQDPRALADLLLHTSCTPPFTPALKREARPVFDGGLVDNVPLSAIPEAERVLVLLTRHQGPVPNTERVTYLRPSREIAVKRWDYTDPEGVLAAFELGRQDGSALRSAKLLN